MRSKTPLAMMEQLVMVLVFALAAALCLQVFVFSDQTSRFNEARDHAVLEAQNAAEALKSGNDSYFSAMSAAEDGNGGYVLIYDDNWQSLPAVSAESAYCLTVRYTESGRANLWAAEVTVSTADGQELFHLPVAGQNWEVSRHG